VTLEQQLCKLLLEELQDHVEDDAVFRLPELRTVVDVAVLGREGLVQLVLRTG